MKARAQISYTFMKVKMDFRTGCGTGVVTTTTLKSGMNTSKRKTSTKKTTSKDERMLGSIGLLARRRLDGSVPLESRPNVCFGMTHVAMAC